MRRRFSLRHRSRRSCSRRIRCRRGRLPASPRDTASPGSRCRASPATSILFRRSTRTAPACVSSSTPIAAASCARAARPWSLRRRARAAGCVLGITRRTTRKPRSGPRSSGSEIGAGAAKPSCRRARSAASGRRSCRCRARPRSISTASPPNPSGPLRSSASGGRARRGASRRVGRPRPPRRCARAKPTAHRLQPLRRWSRRRRRRPHPRPARSRTRQPRCPRRTMSLRPPLRRVPRRRSGRSKARPAQAPAARQQPAPAKQPPAQQTAAQADTPNTTSGTPGKVRVIGGVAPVVPQKSGAEEGATSEPSKIAQ